MVTGKMVSSFLPPPRLTGCTGLFKQIITAYSIHTCRGVARLVLLIKCHATRCRIALSTKLLATTMISVPCCSRFSGEDVFIQEKSYYDHATTMKDNQRLVPRPSHPTVRRVQLILTRLVDPGMQTTSANQQAPTYVAHDLTIWPYLRLDLKVWWIEYPLTNH